MLTSCPSVSKTDMFSFTLYDRNTLINDTDKVLLNGTTKNSTNVHIIGETDLNWEFRESFLREVIFELKIEEWVEINLERESEMILYYRKRNNQVQTCKRGVNLPTYNTILLYNNKRSSGILFILSEWTN